MKRSILFSAPMVLAILAGTKTQTRRIVKLSSTLMGDRSLVCDEQIVACRKEDSERIGKYCFLSRDNGDDIYLPCPYGQLGDRLWVQETWCQHKGARLAYHRVDHPEW